MLKKIIMIVAYVFFAVYLIFWVTHFMVMGKNVSFVFSTIAQMGGAVAEEEEGGGEILFDTSGENVNGMGKGGAIIAKGGGLVDFLAFLFFLTIFFIIERWVTFWQARGKFSESKLMEQIRDHLKGGRYDEAIGACKKQDGVLGRVLLNGIERYKTMKNEANKTVLKESLSEAIDEQTAFEVTLLERRLIAIATIASIATMAGLFGTVVGMIRAFSALSAKGRPDPNKLATGISEALINTAGGLAVAIVSIIAYNYFLAKMDKQSFVIEENSSEMIKILTGAEGV